MNASPFGALGVTFPLVEVLDAQGVTAPFPIQSLTLPDSLAGRDVLGRGRTGSGKTIAFGLPLIARLGMRLDRAARPGRPIGLVLAPTRELATQIDATLAPLAAAYGLTTTTIFGGVSQGRQVEALRRGVDVVVACPGRLEDLMGQGHLRLDAVEITVIDEADHMADLGFLPVVTRILAATPAGGQRMLFSATLDGGVDKLANRFLSNPVRHGVDAPEVPVAMEHHVLTVADVAAKRRTVETLASGAGRRVLFVRTKHTAKRWARDLTAAGIPAADLHGNLSQGQRDRNLESFASGRTRVLVATDVAARGVHVDDIELVVHVDPPAEHKAYLHRSGRTARAGKEGAVVTIVLPEQRRDVDQLMRKAGIRAESHTEGAPTVAELVGDVAPRVAPVAASAHTSQPGARGGQRGGHASRPRAAETGERRAAPGRGGADERPARSGQPARERVGSAEAPRAGAPRGGSSRSRRRRRPASRA